MATRRLEEAKTKWHESQNRYDSNLVKIINKYEHLNRIFGSNRHQPILEVPSASSIIEYDSQEFNEIEPSVGETEYLDILLDAAGVESSKFGSNKQIHSLVCPDRLNESSDELSNDDDFESDNDDDEEDENLADLVSELTELDAANRTQSSRQDPESTVDAIKINFALKPAFVRLTKLRLPLNSNVDSIDKSTDDSSPEEPTSKRIRLGAGNGEKSAGRPDSPDRCFCQRPVYFHGLGWTKIPTLDKSRLNVTLKIPRGLCSIVSTVQSKEKAILAKFARFGRLSGLEADRRLRNWIRWMASNEKFDLLLYYLGYRLLRYQRWFAIDRNSADFVDFQISLNVRQQKALAEL